MLNKDKPATRVLSHIINHLCRSPEHQTNNLTSSTGPSSLAGDFTPSMPLPDHSILSSIKYLPGGMYNISPN